jgi:hypothetical protein
MQICFITYQNVPWCVWITRHQFQKLMTQLQAHLSVWVSGLLCNLNFAEVEVQVTLPSCLTCVKLEHAYVLPP